MSKILEHNVESGEIIEREMTQEELKQQSLDAKNYEEAMVEIQNKLDIRQSLLQKLGITEEEARLLLG